MNDPNDNYITTEADREADREATQRNWKRAVKAEAELDEERAHADALAAALRRIAECCDKEPDCTCEACGKLAKAALVAYEGGKQS